MMKTLRILLVVTAALALPWCKGDSSAKKTMQAEQGQAQERQAIDARIILQIDDQQYSNKDLREYIRVRYADIIGTEENARLLSRLFDRFIEHKIISTIANRENIPVSQDEYSEYLENFKIQNKKIDKDSILEAIRVEKFLYANVYKDIDVSEREIRSYYDSHHEEFTRKREVLLYQILLKDKEKALIISKALKNYPQKFEEFARSDSVSPEGKDNGLLGYFEKGILPKEMEDVVFSLKINEISPVIESPYGYHIFKVTQQRRSGRLQFLSNVEAEIKNKLLSDKLSGAYQDYLSKIKSELTIDIKYRDLYFKYQPMKQEGKDEIKQKNSTDHPDDHSS